MKIVMFNHNIPPSDDYVISFDLKKLDLKQHNLIAWVFGHYHYNYIEENSGMLNISTARPDCGGIDSSISGARMINIAEDGSITTEMTYYDFRQDVTAMPDSVWETSIAGNVLFCDPLFDSGKIYIASVDEDYPRTCGIYCLDASDGKLYKISAENGEIIKTIDIGVPVFGSVCNYENNIYVADFSGRVVCLENF